MAITTVPSTPPQAGGPTLRAAPPPPPWHTVDALGDALHLLRVSGIFYARSELTTPASLAMPAFPGCVWFHVVTSGRIWLEPPDGDPVELRTGDLALVPHGGGHVVATTPGLPPQGRVDEVPHTYVGDHYAVLQHGGGGAATTLVCGIVTIDHPAAAHLLASLPPVLHLDGDVTRTRWLPDTLRLLAGEVAEVRPGGEAITTRLADVLVLQAIRAWIDHDPDARTGWLGAVRDPHLGRALVAFQRDPGRDWTVATLADEAAMSRSSFAARFTEIVGEPAMRFVTSWRMHVALTRLREGATASEVAAELGYRSDAAFHRAFTRTIGVSPGAARRGATPAAVSSG